MNAPPGQNLQVTHLGKYYPPIFGGMEMHLQQICECSRNLVTPRAIVANGDNSRVDEVYNGVQVTRLRSRGLFARTPMVPSYFSEIAKIRDGIVHLHHPNPIPTLAMVTHLRRDLPIVVTYHMDIFKQKYLKHVFHPALNAILRRCDTIIVTSPQYLDTSAVLRPYREKCRVVPLAIDVAAHLQSIQPAEVTRLRSSSKRPIVLAAGRLVAYKGFRYLIEAMKNIDADLWIVGEGPLAYELSQVAAPLKEKVQFIGRVENIANYFAACDIFVLPSINRTEAFGIVQIEALASGKPVINTSLETGVPHVSLHNETGFTVPPRDSNALAAAISRLLNDADLRTRMGNAGRRRASEVFDIRVMAESTCSIYEEVAARRWPGRFAPFSVHAAAKSG
jgi:glycosyltransferase involved in cell wall biosynthesis